MAQTLTASHYYNHDPAIPPGDSRWYLVVDLVDDSGFTGEETINIHLTGDVNDPTATGTMQVNGGVGQYTFPRVASGLYDIWTLDASTAHTVPENSEAPPWVCDVAITNLSHTNETGSGLANGTVTFTATSSAPEAITARLAKRLEGGGTVERAPFSVPNGDTHTFTGLEPGTWYVYLTDAQACVATGADFVVAAYVPTGPGTVPGCMDPNATNFNPSATVDDGTCAYAPDPEVPGEWVSAWRPIEVEIEFGEEVGELPALVEGQLYAAFGQSDLELIATPFAFVGPEGVATFDLAPWLQRMKINAPGFGLNYHLFQRYRFVVPGHYTGPISYCLNSTLPHTALAPNPNMALSPFGNRVPFWPGFMACATYLTETYAQTAVFSAIQTAGATPVQEGITFVEQPCPDYPLQLVWFDPVGGWATWVFGLAASFETEVSDGSTFTTPGRVKHYADRGQVVSRVSVSSGPIADRSLLEGLRQIRRAVQCYQYKNGSFIPVMIEGGTFADGRANDRRQSVSLTFRYAEALISQRQ